MYKDDRIAITFRHEYEDYLRSLEIYSTHDGERNPWLRLIPRICEVLASAAGAVCCFFAKEWRLFIALVLFFMIFAPYLLVSISDIYRTRRQKREYYENAAKGSKAAYTPVVRSCYFGRNAVFLRGTAWDEPVTYRSLDRCVEYSDGLYLENRNYESRSVVFIPSRFLSQKSAQEIISRIKSGGGHFTCIEKLRAAKTAQTEPEPEELFDLGSRNLLFSAQYTLTGQEEKAASGGKLCYLSAKKTVIAGLLCGGITAALCFFIAVMVATIGDTESYIYAAAMTAVTALIVWAAYYGSVSSISHLQKKYVRAEAQYGSHIALYDDLACVRVMGDDTLVMYNWLTEVIRTDGFVVIKHNLWGKPGSVPRAFFTVPVRALDDADEFVRLLEDRISAAREGLVDPFSDLEESAQDIPETQPLRRDDLTGKNILTARYRNTDICIRRKFNATELIIDGTVFARQKELIEGPYELTAVVDSVVYIARQHPSGELQLFAQGMEIASTIHRI